MGEESWRIHTVGSLYIDRIIKKMYTPASETCSKYGLEKNQRYAIALLHPDTFETVETNYQVATNMFAALKSTGLKTIVVHPCSDPGYEGIKKAIAEIEEDDQFIVFKNIDNLDFLGLMSGAVLLIGNSSCGLVEAPYFQLSAINIGKRQLDRGREGNVIDSGVEVEEVIDHIQYVQTDVDFKKNLQTCGKRLGSGGVAEKIIEILKTLEINETLLRKRMTY